MKLQHFIFFDAILLLILLGGHDAQAVTRFHTDTYESGTVEGWAGGAFPTVVFGGPGGAMDQFLQVSCSGGMGVGAHCATHNENPEWTGSYTPAGIQAISADMMVPVGFPAVEMRLVLFSPPETGARWTSSISKIVPNDGIWRHYQFSIAASDLTQVVGAITYGQLLDNVFSVMLRHDDGTPSTGGTSLVGRVGIDNVHVTVCDFDGDADCDIADLDMLTMAVAGMTGNLMLDANGDGVLSTLDIARWRLDAGFRNIGASYLAADANLDGVVDGTDFNVWNGNKFTTTGKWSQADFNIDGVTDGTDFNLWNSLKFTSSDGPQLVPEPLAGMLVLAVACLAATGRHRRFDAPR